MYRVDGSFGILFLIFLLGMTVIVMSQNAIQEDLTVNSTDEPESEKRLWLNATEAQPLENEATEGMAPESEATEVMAAGSEATEAMVVEETNTASTEATLTPVQPGHNISNMETLKEWGAHLLASKYMGSLAILYLALCVFLAIKNGPIFVH